MSETPITQAELNSLKTEISNFFREMNSKLDRLLDPESGVFAKIQIVDTKSEKAHERLDRLGSGYDNIKVLLYGSENNEGLKETVKDLKEHKERVSATIKKIFWAVVAPILTGIGVGIYQLFLK